MKINSQTLVENIPTALMTVDRACELAEDYFYKPANLVAPALISKLQNISLFALQETLIRTTVHMLLNGRTYLNRNGIMEN